MNNDVAGNLNNNFGANKVNFVQNNTIKKAAAQKTCDSVDSEVINKSMGFMGTLGLAQVKMNKNMSDGIKSSTQAFMANPDLVQAHVDFCDSLVENGYCLKDAIDMTDKVFEVLNQKETY